MSFFFKRMMTFILLILCAWIGGLFTYGRAMPEAHHNLAKKYDAVIVLTGGEARIHYGISLLQYDVAPTLFITGVSNGYSFEAMQQESILDSATLNTLKPHIAYGEKARDTFGNAKETAQWLSTQKNARNLLVVTANYHIMRSTLIFKHYLKEYNLTFAAVDPPKFDYHNWLLHDNSRRLVISEYHKYLITWLRLAIFGK